MAGVLGGVAFSAPPSEIPFPELKKQPPRELTVLDRAVLEAAGDLQHGRPPSTPPDAVAFLLWLYREDGDRKHLDWAMGKARELAREGLERGGVAALYQTALAGSPTRVEAEDAYRRRQEETSSARGMSTEFYATLVLDSFARAALLDTPSAVADALLATGSFWQSRTRRDGNALRALTEDGKPESLAGHVAALRVGIEATALSGSSPVRDECRLLAHEILAKFWNDGREQFVDGGVLVTQAPATQDRPMPGSQVGSAQTVSVSDTQVANAQAALAVWEMGMVCGDQLLIGRGQRALESGLESALADPIASPSVGLAAGRMSRHPVQMALIGHAAEPILVQLRQAAYSVFEPAKLMLNLDPAQDAARFAELLYPAELAPALFICVETICSVPITQAEGLPERVREIRKLAADTPE